MPELPEVEAARKYVDHRCAGAKIATVVTRELGGGPRDGLFDELVYDVGDENLTESQIHDVFIGRTLKRVCRKGKQLWLEFTDTAEAVMFHFGMTGSIALKGHDIPLYFRSNVKDRESWPPKFTKLLIAFSDGTELAFCDPRRLGRIKIRTVAGCKALVSKLGLDPTVDAIPSAAEIKIQLSDLSAPIKAVLLDQERIFSGIGNYLADEILYQARIHPASKANALSEAHVASLLEAMQRVLKIAIDADADYRLFPADWLFHVRWSKAKSKTQKIVLPNGQGVVFEEVGGRTSAVVPSVQVRVTAGTKLATAPAPHDASVEATAESKGLKKTAAKNPRKRKAATEEAQVVADARGNNQEGTAPSQRQTRRRSAK